MQPSRMFVIAASVLFSVAAVEAQRSTWLPVSAQERAITDVPGSSGAPAILLYYRQDIDDSAVPCCQEWVYRRIKVLNEKGARFANVEIVVNSGDSISELQARTIHPDGKVFDLAGKPFDKVLMKERGMKVTAKSFAFPAVTPGSIVEYRYKRTYPPDGTSLHEWEIQHELYTLKESFRIKTFSGSVDSAGSGTRVWLCYQLPGNVQPVRKGDGFELEVHDVPTLETEPFMPPPSQYAYGVHLFYGGREMASADAFWRDTGRELRGEAERFMSNHRAVQEAAALAIGNETDPFKKLRALYAQAQQIRNLTYERSRSRVELRKENLKMNQSVGEVVARGYGERDDITRAFIAMARAAGYPAFLVRVADRSKGFFNRNILSSTQMDTEIAVVTVNGQDILLDPGTKFCPFGLLPWMRTSAKALKLVNDGEFFDTPSASKDMAAIRRVARAVVDEEGVLQGELTVSYFGSEALARRLEAWDTDEAGRTKNLEDEVQAWLPPQATVKLTEAEDWQSSEGPLKARFTISIPSFASVTGTLLVVPAGLFQLRQKDAFNVQERKYPVYFPYAFTDADDVEIRVPAGYSLKTLPTNQQASTPSLTYKNEVQADAFKLTSRRTLEVNGIFFSTAEYPEVRSFFNAVQSSDGQQVVFQGGVHAQKSN
jgi:hypothetical protein